MTKIQIIDKVNKMFQNNEKIDKAFYPIIEEFFARLAEEFSLSEQELDKKIDQYGKIEAIKFEKLKEGEARNCSNLFHFNDQINEFEGITDLNVSFSISDLKNILLGNKNELDKFIETAFHEFGHSIQLNYKKEFAFSGLAKTYYSAEKQKSYTQGKMINEIAEVISSQRLMHGNLIDEVYGYKAYRELGKAIITSLGISEKELSELQMKEMGREEYEKCIEQKLGKGYEPSLMAIESAFDTVHSIINTEKINDESKQNIGIQLKNINFLCNDILKKRIINAGKNNITELALISIDNKDKNRYISNVINKYENVLPEKFEINNDVIDLIKETSPLTDMEALNKEIDRIENERIINLLDDCNSYNNEYLANKIIESMRSIDISKYPLKQRIELSIYKKIGNIKGKFEGTKIQKLPEKTYSSFKERRNKFKTRINNGYALEEYNNMEIDNIKNMQKGKGENEDIRENNDR